MKKILIISTGGTFNKVYNPVNGELQIDKTSSAIKEIAHKWLCELEVVHIIGKDSLEMTNTDRKLLFDTIKQSSHSHIIVVHGTDTMEISAKYIADSTLEQTVIFTGAMIPYSIDPTEATSNLCSAYGYLQGLDTKGIYIAMNGVLGKYDVIKKNHIKGRFEISTK